MSANHSTPFNSSSARFACALLAAVIQRHSNEVYHDLDEDTIDPFDLTVSNVDTLIERLGLDASLVFELATPNEVEQPPRVVLHTNEGNYSGVDVLDAARAAYGDDVTARRAGRDDEHWGTISRVIAPRQYVDLVTILHVEYL
ncbi:hypothetical protein QP922_09620 [Corynebacterium sp. MSK218]|uniref:hypothetical protein n=1 Tax=Corynebacterium sp. MSK218 TaxID=3050218 RepID=UPI00254F9CC1|nr:hypothetical protein [Corynebacterium sp. MSK218]MDK8764076.1 hypothetical protein [Corynebacterium sp. MSK218]